MKLRFKLDQGKFFRKGIDCPKSIIVIEVDPATIPERDRNLIADRLCGIDVCELWNDDDGTTKSSGHGADGKPNLIIADSPDLAGLMKAIRSEQLEVEAGLARHRSLAFARACEDKESTASGKEDDAGDKGKMLFIKQSDEFIIHLQKHVRKRMADGKSLKEVGQAFQGSYLDGIDLNKLLAADTMEKRLDFMGNFLLGIIAPPQLKGNQ